ncbi:MAG: zinc metallopeptidase [Bacilli bacterium]
MNNFIINYDLLIWIGLILTITSQIIVSASYSRYKKKLNNKDLTGYDVARKILDKNNLNDIIVLEIKGNLTDHYDPARKTIKLSTDIYHGSSIASLAVAAHECGHAIQDKDGYKPMRIRSKIVPTVNICTRIGYLAIIIGAIFSYKLMEIGIILLLALLAFQIITLPVEFNASKRALNELKTNRFLDKDETKDAKNMLLAAAFTYVASMLSTLLEILRYVLIFVDRDR